MAVQNISICVALLRTLDLLGSQVWRQRQITLPWKIWMGLI